MRRITTLFLLLLLLAAVSLGLAVAATQDSEAQGQPVSYGGDGYVILNASFNDLFLTGSDSRNGPVTLASDFGDNTLWRFERVPGKAGATYAYIRNAGDGSYLHLKRDGTVNTTPVRRGTERRYHWQIGDTEADLAVIAPRNGTRYLDADLVDGTYVVDVDPRSPFDEGMSWFLYYYVHPTVTPTPTIPPSVVATPPVPPTPIATPEFPPTPTVGVTPPFVPTSTPEFPPTPMPTPTSLPFPGTPVPTVIFPPTPTSPPFPGTPVPTPEFPPTPTSLPFPGTPVPTVIFPPTPMPVV